MQIRTRSRQIHKALARAQARIPSKDWQTIVSFLSWIHADVEWQMLLPESIDPSSAALLPIYKRSTSSIIGAQIRFHLPVFRLFSDKARIGIIAHEFGHALRAEGLGEDWHGKMNGGVRDESEERLANGIASKWGFGKEIKAMLNERKQVVGPYIAKHEAGIVARILERLSRDPFA
jgi:hypothetical protein